MSEVDKSKLIFVNTNKTREVLELQYIRIVQWLMVPLSLWPIEKDNAWFNHINRFFSFSVAVGSFIATLLHMIIHFSELPNGDIGKRATIVNYFGTYPVIYLLLWLGNFKNLSEVFLFKFHLVNYKDRIGYSDKIRLKYDKISQYVTVYFVGICFFIFVSSFFNPLIVNFTSGAFSKAIDRANGLETEDFVLETTYFLSMPFNYSQNIYGWVAKMIICLYVFMLHAFLISARTSFLAFLYIQMIAHCENIINNLIEIEWSSEISNKTLFVYTKLTNYSFKFNQSDQIAIEQKLKTCIKQHQDLLKKVSRAWNGVLLLEVYFFTSNLPFALFGISELPTSNLLIYVPIFMAIILQVLQLATLADMLTSSGEVLARAVYAVPWECMDKRNQKTVHIFLCSAQIPFEMNPFSIIRVNIPLAVTILKNAFSFYRILRETS